MATCRFCGKEKSDATAPDLGCEPCESALELYAELYRPATSDADAAEIEAEIGDISDEYPATYAAINDIQDAAELEANRVIRQEAAYRRFQVEGAY